MRKYLRMIKIMPSCEHFQEQKCGILRTSRKGLKRLKAVQNCNKGHIPFRVVRNFYSDHRIRY